MKICPECKTEYENIVQVCPKDGAVLVPKRRKDPLLDSLIDGKYRIHRRIGGGGMGSVYRAEHTMMKRIVAVKVLHNHFAEDEDYDQFIRRFQREARTASQIDHPNAVTIHDFGVYADQAYLVMQLVEGRSLKKEIAQRKRLPQRAVVQISNQVCAALAAAHKAGIVHRDLKPDNIMVAQQPDGDYSAVVLDFGIAKVLGAADLSGTSVTKVGKVVGTPQYMAPEQVLGKELDHRSDIYSLGVIFYQMLCGKPPFDAPSLMPLMMKHVHDEPVPLGSVDPELNISQELESVVMRALSKDPKDRQQTMTQLSAEMEAAYDEESDQGADEELKQATVVGPNILPGSGTQPAPQRIRTMRRKRPPKKSLTQTALVALLLGVLVLGVAAQFIFQEVDEGLPREGVDTTGSETTETNPIDSPGIVGIGIRTAMLNDDYVITAVRPNSAAAKAGLRKGDIIVEIDGTIVERLTALQAADRIRGPEGSTVELAVLVDGSLTPSRVLVTREVIETTAVERIKARSEQLWLQGDAVASLKLLEDALAQYPGEPELRLAYGIGLQRTGRLNEAIENYKLAIEADPTQAGAFYNLGLCYMRLGNLVDSLDAFREAIIVEPLNGDAHKYLAEVLLKLGKAEQALPEFREAIRLKPKDAVLHYSTGLAYAQLGLVVEAVREYKTAIELNANDSRFHRILGTTLLIMGQTTDAKKSLLEALRLNPNDADAHLQLGNLYLETGEVEPGVDSLKAALRLNPNFRVAKVKLAEVYLAQSRFDEAVPMLQEAIALDDSEAAIHAGLGVALNNLGRFAEAVPVLERAKELDPQRAVVFYNLGNAYGNLGNFAEARDAFLRTVSLDPRSAVAYYNLAKAHEKLGEQPQAKRYYAEALRLSPENSLFQEANEMAKDW